MKKEYNIDISFYSEQALTLSIEQYKDIMKISLYKDILTIEGRNQEEIEESFREFCNYVASINSMFLPKKAFTSDDFSNIDIGESGYFRYKKFDTQTYLITNDIGKFHFLSYDSFSLLIQGKYRYIEGYQELIEKGFIKVKNYEAEMIKSYRKKTSYIGMGPALHMIVVTLRCNHHCKYCHAAVAPETATEYDMDIETATKVVDTILYTNSPNLTIEFQGGEALLNWDVVQHIVNYAKEKSQYLNKDVSFTLVTNLTLMTEEKLSWLMDEKVDICTSLDGNEHVHNENRTGYKGNSFEQVSYWIKRINEEKPKIGLGKIGALLTTTKDTLPYYKEIIDAYLDLGLDGIFLRWLNPYGFAASDLKNLSYTTEEWLSFYEKSLDYVIELNKRGTDFREYITNIYLMKIFMDFDPAFMDVRNPSGMVIGGVAYNYDGKVYASDESRMLGRMGIDDFFLTNMLESGKETYIAMMNSDVTKTVVQASTLDGLPGYNDHVYKPYIGVDVLHNFKVNENVFVPMSKDEKTKIQIGILDIIFTRLRDPEINSIFLSWLEKRG